MGLAVPMERLQNRKAGVNCCSLVQGLISMTEIAYLGGGCFWCVEAAFNQLQGVQRVISGYMGGRTQNPTYEQVCSGRTGHVEVGEITFDPNVISYEEILEVFFTVHDPTTLNRQGNDIGEQYRSVIFYRDEDQRKTAEQVIAELKKEHAFKDPIVTAIEPVSTFYPAENYHQDYFKNHPYQPYCMFVVSPKVKKVREKYAARLKA
jgi:peptide-methionine (S)-S-oxide reductase